MKPDEKGRILSASRHWQTFFLCVILHMLLPLLPLGFEFWSTQTVSDRTMTLAASMYTIAVGASSRNPALFGLAILLSISLAAAFGFASSERQALSGSGHVSAGAILLVFVFHVIERYNRHVAEGRPFLPFDREED